MGPNAMYEVKQPPTNSVCSCPNDSCVKIGYQYADISVPVELKPSAAVGDIVIECCGEPNVSCRESKCGDSCEVIITQKVSIKIPINYQVSARAGNSTVNCDFNAEN